jgi:glutamine synthetase
MSEPVPSPPAADEFAWIRLGFVDMFGVGHVLHVPAARFATVVDEGLAFDGSALEGHARNVEADMLLVPDRSTLIRWRGDVGQVVCTARSTEGSPWHSDPRIALQDVVTRLGDLGEATTVGAELELYLLTPAGEPVDTGGYYDEDDGLGIHVVRSAASRLAAAGVPVQGCHHEAGPGQYEVDIAPLPPVSLADAVMLAKQLAREEASAAGLLATFMPRPLDGEAGSGLHLHQSAGDLLVDAKGALTDEGRGFVAGQLGHARALSALCAPTINSYKRLHSGPEAPSAAVWAHRNRGALVRVGTSIEYRGADPSANPYLALAALFTAAADGIASGAELPRPSEEDAVGGYDPAAALHTRFDPLPRDLDDALDALQADEVVLDAFDGQLVARLVDGRRAESAAYSSRVTQWELDNYLEQPGDWRGGTGR